MEDVPQAVAKIQAETGFEYGGYLRQGQTQFWLGEVTQPTFVDDLWHAYHW